MDTARCLCLLTETLYDKKSSFYSTPVQAITKSFRILRNGNREGQEHAQEVRAGPTKPAERPFAEAETGRAWTCGDKAPDADLCHSHRVANGPLEC
jgi:hypothetical protein